MSKPVVIATWPFGAGASAAGYQRLLDGGSALDAVESAGNFAEDDPEVYSVGYGGLPNALGIVELDAAIMDGRSHLAGAVCALVDIGRPISVARVVMEKSPHVMLAAEGARSFAINHGFLVKSQLTETAARRWEEWKASEKAAATVAHFPSTPLVPDNHDTIGICAIDSQGDLAAGCTTSGMAWKLPGRVGDSPILGAGLYVDNTYGAAAATGHGDEMMKASLSYRTVMNMASGMNPTEACVEALRYLLSRRSTLVNPYGAAIVALRKDGATGAAATKSGFELPSKTWNWATADSSSPHGIVRQGPYVDIAGVYPTLD